MHIKPSLTYQPRTHKKGKLKFILRCFSNHVQRNVELTSNNLFVVNGVFHISSMLFLEGHNYNRLLMHI